MSRPAAFDLVVLDAFSSDSIPVHLMTAEAIATEWRTVRPGGLIGFHISNRYYDLAPAIAAGARAARPDVMERSHAPSDAQREAGATPSRWLAASADPAVIAQLEALGWTRAVAGGPPVHGRLLGPAPLPAPRRLSPGGRLSRPRLPPQPSSGPGAILGPCPPCALRGACLSGLPRREPS